MLIMSLVRLVHVHILLQLSLFDVFTEKINDDDDDDDIAYPPGSTGDTAGHCR